MNEKTPRYFNLQDKLNAHKRIDGDCWLWTGFGSPGGYGRMKWKGELLLVHRLSYCLYHNINIDDLKELVLHKLTCPNRRCFNPDHLYLGDHKQNTADTLTAGHHKQENQTHCIHGHEFTEANTYMTGEGRRQCKACNILRTKLRRRGIPRSLGLSDIERQVLDNYPKEKL